MNILSLRSPTGIVFTAVSAAVFAYLLAPLIIIVIASLGATGYVKFPPIGFSLAAYGNILKNPYYVSGLLTSFYISAAVTAVSAAVGIPASYALARYRFAGSRTLESLLLAPLTLPGLVLAVALTIFFPHTPIGDPHLRIMLAHLTICVPCFMRVTIPAFQQFDRSVEEAAMSLGATPLRTFAMITLPAAGPGVAAAAAISFILSFDEVEMAVFLSGPVRPPLTVVLFTEVQIKFEPALTALSACLILVPTFVILLIGFIRRFR